MTQVGAFAGLLFSVTVYAQFEVASVKRSPPNRDNGPVGITTGNGRMTAYDVTLKRCIMSAFAVGQNQIAGGPDWFESERYDIVAHAEQSVGDRALMGMLQTLLMERFKLGLHREMRKMPAFVISVAKGGPKLEKSAGGDGSTTYSRGRLEVRATTMDSFAERLGRMLDRPVVNRSELEGVFDFKLEWAPDDAVNDVRPSIFTAMQRLGLRLRVEKTAVEVLVIDHAEKPTAN